MVSLGEALPDSTFEVVNGATAASLTRDWDPGTVSTFSSSKAAQRSGRNVGAVPFPGFVRCSLQETPRMLPTPKTRCRRHNGGCTEADSTAVAAGRTLPLLVLVPSRQKRIVPEVLKAGAHSCLILLDQREGCSQHVASRAANRQSARPAHARPRKGPNGGPLAG